MMSRDNDIGKGGGEAVSQLILSLIVVGFKRP